MQLIKKMLRSVYHLHFYIYVKTFAWLFYDKKYLTGKYFSHGIYSQGWIWAAKDIKYRLRTWNHIEIRYPIGPNMMVGNSKRVYFHPDDLNNLQGNGCYFQVFDDKAKIVIGKGSYIAQNVGIITTNHDINDPDKHLPGRDVIIGEKCWIGMNAMILPGVNLGDHTVVGAGSVVTKSFPEGYVVIAGNPAKIIKTINKEKEE